MVDNVHPGTPVGQLFAHLATGGGRKVQIDGRYIPPPSHVCLGKNHFRPTRVAFAN